MQTTPPLRTRFKPLAVAGLPIAIARLAAEPVAPQICRTQIRRTPDWLALQFGWHFGGDYSGPDIMLIVGAH